MSRRGMEHQEGVRRVASFDRQALDIDEGSPLLGGQQQYVEYQEARSCGSSCCSIIKDNIFIIFMVLGIGLGIAVGVLLRVYEVHDPDDVRTIMYWRFPGEVFLRLLKMLILPLIFSNLVNAVANLDKHAAGRMGILSVLLYVVTTLIAIVLGILLVFFIQPGYSVDTGGRIPNIIEDKTDPQKSDNPFDALLDLIRNLFTDNIFAASFRSTETMLVPQNKSDLNNNLTVPLLRNNEESPNLLGIVFYALWMGIILARIGDIGQALVEVIRGLEAVTMKMVTVVIWLSPIAIVFLVIAEVIKVKNINESMKELGLYMLTVLTGLFVHGYVIIPLIYLVLTRKNPFIFVAKTFKAQAIAFGTASGSATLPVSLNCLEENLQIDRRVTRFVMPVGTTINMNGTALYEAVATIFIAQLSGIDLSIEKYIIIAVTATCAAVGAASIPQAGLVTMIIVLGAAGIPSTEVARVLAVDWLLDRFRTMVNVLGDCFVTGIVAHNSEGHLGPAVNNNNY